MKTTYLKIWEKNKTVWLTIRLIVGVAMLLLLYNCEHATPPIKKVLYCPPPVLDLAGMWKSPNPFHAYQRCSFNGENIIFKSQSEAFILNTKSGVLTHIDIQSLLPNNVLLSSTYRFFWCPYDNNKVLIHAITSTDTIGDGKRYYYGQNIYMVSLNPFDVKRVTPSILGPAGAPINFNVYSWLPESKDNNDLIRMSYVINGTGYRKKYLIQEDKMFDVIEDYYFRAISKNGEYLFSYKGNSVWVINDNEFIFNEEIGLDYSSFSPSGKYLALSVLPNNQGSSEEERRFNEIWIVNVEKFLKAKPDTVVPDRIINLRFDYCMYAMVASPCAEFISETELAVAMYKDGDDKAYLWKVGIDGKLLGQLTFEP